MKRIRAGVTGIWDFIVGDDWVTAAPPKNRDVEAEKARARARTRYAS